MKTAPGDAVEHEVTLELARTQRAGNPNDFQGQKPQEYMLRLEKGGVRTAIFPWSARVQEDLEALGRQKPDPVAALRLGEDLRRFLDELDWGGYEKKLEEAARGGGALRLALRSAAAELYSLPWELATLKDGGLHLAEVPGFSLRYEWPSETSRAARTEVAPQGRALLAWSEAGTHNAVPEDEHVQALLKASEAGGFDFDPQRDVLPRVSLVSLAEKLNEAREARQPVTVLHVLCHGVQLEGSTPGHYGLAWNVPGDQGGMDVVDGRRLKATLAPYADTLRMVVLCACHGGDGGRLASPLGSVAQELHRAGIEMVLASRLPLSLRGSELLAQTLYEKLLVESTSLEEALGAVRQKLLQDSSGFDWASLQLYAHREGPADLRPVVLRPYLGLWAFGPKDRHFFFGRSQLEAQLLERVKQAALGQRPRFQVVAGASGAGKSSVVMAGLVPRLSPSEWDWLKVRPGELVRAAPGKMEGSSVALRELRSQLHRVCAQEPLATDAESGLHKVVEEARRLKQARPGQRLLLVVDQFEEIFTQLGAKERQSLMEALWALAREPGLECVVVATIRVDYFERCAEVMLGSGPRLESVMYSEEHRVFVEQLGPEELAEAIEKPAHRVGLVLEEGLVERLCQDVGQEPGALPLLEHSLDRLWQKREGNRLTHEAYEQMGGVAGGLAQTAESLFKELAEEECRQVRRLMVELVSLGETTPDIRRRVWLQEVQPAETMARAAFERVMERLVEKRLVIRGREAEGARRVWLEVAHEALIRRWDRMREWLQKNRTQLLRWRELQAMADTWQAHRKDADGGNSYLATGARLVYACGIRDEHEGQPTASVREFLEACEAQAQRRRQDVVSLTTRLHTTVDTLKYIGGTVSIRNELLTLVERVLLELDSANEPEPLHVKAVTHVSRGDAAMTHANTASAQTEYSQALTLARQLLASHPNETVYQHTFATIHLGFGRLAQTRGQLVEASEHYWKYHETLRAILQAKPMHVFLKHKLANNHLTLGEVALQQGLLEEARRQFESALSLEQELLTADATNADARLNFARSHDNLGHLATTQGKLAEAQGHHERSHAVFLELSADYPASTTLRNDLARSYVKLGNLARAQGRLEEARRHYESSHALRRKLSEADPTDAHLKQSLAISHNSLGGLAKVRGRLEEARRHHESSHALLQELAGLSPTNATFKQSLAFNHDSLGDLAKAQGRLEEARRHHESAHTLRQELSEADSTNADFKQNLAVSYYKLGELAKAQDRLEDARRHYESAHVLLQKLSEISPTDAKFKQSLAYNHDSLGSLARAEGRLEEARRHHESAHTLRRELTEADPTNADFKQNLAISHDRLGDLAAAEGRLEEARRHHGSAHTLRQELSEADPTNAEFKQNLAVSHDRLGKLSKAEGRLEEARRHYESAHELLRELSEADPTNAQIKRNLVVTHHNLRDWAKAERRLEEARRHHESAHELLRELSEADPTNAQLQQHLARSHDELLIPTIPLG